MGNPPDIYYKILNISKDSSPHEIRSAYKSLVRKWHPDKHPPSSKPEAEARFKSITEAYEALSDQQENRALFGANCGGGGGGGGGNIAGGGINGVNGGAAAGGSAAAPGVRRGEKDRKNEEGVWCNSAGNVGRSRAALAAFKSSFERRKLPPVERKIECSLEELCRGSKKEIKVVRDVVAKNGVIAKKEETLTIRIKPGWRKGTKITFENMGDERPGCLAADLVFVIKEKEHPIFKRVGNDLVLKVEVPLINALTGWAFSFRLLTGEKMNCSFDEEIIYPGYEKVIKGQGMPLASEKALARGDLRIKFSIVFPKKLSDEQRSGLVELLRDCT
ncbi:dnaJ protein homolog 1-like [Ananas comosus]|uniref:DnaJ protein n=1 Tax=Ananas comosus TaxID=4615 RepID=A0A199VN04_ANACO|nr:dnaJ protein homolog 1-like [Ananas comosus]OAY78567.1 DnaJ protein [Ananas comosus]